MTLLAGALGKYLLAGVAAVVLLVASWFHGRRSGAASATSAMQRHTQELTTDAAAADASLDTLSGADRMRELHRSYDRQPMSNSRSDHNGQP